jgi:hypothetical protein
VNLDERKEAALNVALNKISGKWDLPKLKNLLSEIDIGDFDIEVTGFDEGEMKRLFGYVDDDNKPFLDNDVFWQIIIECNDENQQRELLEEFKGRGIFCRPLML